MDSLLNDDIRRVIENTLIPHTAFQAAIQRLQQGLNYSLGSSEPICMAIVGESRTGKSRVLEEVESIRPRSRTANGAVVPILRIRVPSSPTVKGLAEVMLRALGDPNWEKGTQNNKTARLQTQMTKAETIMLMLDEFQHFFDKGTQKIFHDAADWLKILVDETRVTLVVCGLESCLPVLLRNEQLSGRFLAPIFIRRFNWLDDGDRESFVGILDSFTVAVSEHFDMPDLSSDGMAYRCWVATGGLMGYLTKFLRQVVWTACDEGARKITLEDLAKAHQLSICSATEISPEKSPFNRSFSVDPTQEAISNAFSLGEHVESIQPERPLRRTKTPAKASLAQTLAAT